MASPLDDWKPFAPVPADEAPADALIRLLVLDYGRWRPEDLEEGRAWLARAPELGRANVWAAAACGDAAAVRQFVDEDPARVHALGGPYGWPPLLYGCYARVPTLAAVRVLLAAGADPDAAFLWEGAVPPFTALTGAFGEGEKGRNEPPHPEREALARALLDAGADPDDGQTLYNRHFRRADDHLRLLFEYGLGRPRTGRWRERQEPPAEMLATELWYAARKNFGERVELLLAHGVPVDRPGPHGGRTPWQEAMDSGNVALAARLVAAGAVVTPRTPAEQLATAWVAGDAAAARALLDADPSLRDAFAAADETRLVGRAVEARHPAGLRLMASFGFDLDGPPGATPLHQVAWGGDDDLDLLALLLELGASPDRRDPTFHARPIGWAYFNRQPAAVAALLPYADIFDAVGCDGPDRAAALLAADPTLARATDDDGDPLPFYLHRGLHHLDELIALLHRHGARFDARHHTGATLADWLRATRNHRVVAALARAGLAA